MSLEWRQHDHDPACWVSACGQYSVGFDHVVQTWRAYRLAPGGPWFAPFSREPLTTIDDAKAACEGDTQ